MGETVAQSLARRGLGREVWDQDLVLLSCCVLGLNTLLAQCLSLPGSVNGYQQTFRKIWSEMQRGRGGGAGGVICNGIASHLIELVVILVDKHKHRLCLFVNSYNITWHWKLVRGWSSKQTRAYSSDFILT